MEYDFVCDGKPHAAYLDRTATCTGDAATGVDFTASVKGKTVLKSHHTFTPDGKTQTIDYTDMRPDGTTADTTFTYQRIGQGTGIPGTWKSVKEESSQPNICVISVSGGVWHEEHPAEKAKVDAKLDGAGAHWTGGNFPEGAISSYKREGANKIHIVLKYKNTVMEEEILVLSADGKTFTDETWPPGKMAEKQTELYEKQ